MSLKKFFNKLGYSWHDIFIVILLFETCWWGMFAFMDSADMVLRAINESGKTEYHVFVIVQKCISILKLLAVVTCLWFGIIFAGYSLYLRVYLFFGIFIDTILCCSWIVISTEEAWPLSPTNIYGAHYIITFILLRIVIYTVLFSFTREIFASPFGPPVIGTNTGTVIGIPEQGSNRTLNYGSNLVFLGKGINGLLQHYKLEVEHAFLVSVLWDVFWNWGIIFTQELPEVAFSYIFVGIFGSPSLSVSTDDLVLRATRVILGLIAIYLAMKKNELYMRIWIIFYLGIMFVNIGLLLFIFSNSFFDETFLSGTIVCFVFFGSAFAKLFVLYCSARFYMHLKKTSTRSQLVQENNNENEF